MVLFRTKCECKKVYDDFHLVDMVLFDKVTAKLVYLLFSCDYRTIDSIIAGYGKGKLKCLLADPMSVFDMVSSKSINPQTPPQRKHTLYILRRSACIHVRKMCLRGKLISRVPCT